MKTCTRCGEAKPLDQFHHRNASSDGLQPGCKDCCKKDSLSRYQSGGSVQVKRYQQSFAGKLVQYRRNAKGRGIPFLLTDEQFSTYWQVPCSYCSSEISTVGIDRIDSSIGYQLDNCVSCCTTCNIMKMDIDEDEWYEHMIKILKHKGRI